MEPGEETSLIDQCRAGTASAWDRVFDQLYGPTTRFIWRVVPDASAEDVQEICQDTFLALVRNLGSFSGKCRLQTWLFRIASNKARDFRDRRLAAKRGGGRAAVSLDADDPVTGRRPQPVSRAAAPVDRLAEEESLLEVRRCLDQLGGPCREILELRYFGDLDYEAIGASLGLNPRTVSSRLSRCLAKLGEGLRRVRLADEVPPKPH